jgi:hypothetical protein
LRSPEDGTGIALEVAVVVYESLAGDVVLETEKFPTGVAQLNAGLSNVYGYDFPHCKFIYVAAQTNF